MDIDVVTTATIRPAILQQTYSSFTKNVLTDGHSYRLILNIDPIGDKASPQNVLDVANAHFKNVVYRIASSPSFASAVIWGWKQTTADLVFHLEDDWRSCQPVDISDVLGYIQKHQEFSSFGLSKLNRKQLIQRGKLHKNKILVEVDKISLNPVFIRGDFVRSAAKLMSTDHNPEKQLRIADPRCGRFIKGTRHCSYSPGPCALVEDIGRQWMEETKKFRKRTGFKNWEQI